jgi:hypothetical protein
MDEKQVRDNSGMIYRNSFKKKGDNQPSMRGFVTVAGVEYHVTAWTRFSQNDGSKCLSIQFQKRDEWQRERDAYKAKNGGGASAPAPAPADDDDMPF